MMVLWERPILYLLRWLSIVLTRYLKRSYGEITPLSGMVTDSVAEDRDSGLAPVAPSLAGQSCKLFCQPSAHPLSMALAW